MIIVRLAGGLGNQMFQYAAGRALAARVGTELKLDRSFLDGEQRGHTRRSYELGCFDVKASFASRVEIVRFAPVSREILLRPLLLARKALHRVCSGSRVLVERCFTFDERFTSCRDNTYLSGYWQSGRYFEGIGSLIREEFSFPEPLSGRNAELACEIAATESVSLHVRRGDYCATPQMASFHVVCDEAYYSKAIAHLSSLCKSPHFYLFSDDPEWVRENLQCPFPFTVVDHNGDRNHLDMRLMSLCRHNICANSSFSWWGAWLNGNGRKVVVAPGRWTNDERTDCRDLIPDGWFKITPERAPAGKGCSAAHPAAAEYGWQIGRGGRA